MIFEKEKIIAVIRGRTAKNAFEIAKACYEGGIKLLEITFTTPEAEKTIEILSENLSDAIIGAGTVISEAQFNKAIEVGAKFVVSPHLSETLSEIARSRDICYIPGIMTPTEYVKARELNCHIVKIFPGNVLTPSFITSMKGPFPEIKCIPTGGVSLENINEWLKAGAIAVGIGSSLTKGTINDIKRKAESFVKKIRGYEQ